ncbi:hypothetical protein ACFE04_028033 [Oxalis oulophora]
MSNPIERYQNLNITESLSKIHRYPIACEELSSIIRISYKSLPKNVQSLLFQDIINAFRLLPNMQTSSAVSAAHLLFQSADAALPKQKRSLAISEFKQAKVALKRNIKARRQEERESSSQLPEDVLVHIFSSLDMQSLVFVSQVCWLWNLAASDNHLWKLQYNSFFGDPDNCTKTVGHPNAKELGHKGNTNASEDMVSTTSFDWKEAFKRSYIGKSSKWLYSNRGYCGTCDTIVWLNNMKCFNELSGIKSANHHIKPVSHNQVVEYLIDDNFSGRTSSDSESESDEESTSILWAYRKRINLSS